MESFMQKFKPATLNSVLYEEKSAKNVSTFINNFNKCTNGEFYILPNQQFVSVREKLEFKHICGVTISMSPTNMLNVGKGTIKTSCKKCSLTKRDNAQRMTKDSFYNKFKSLHEHAEEYTIVSEYYNTDTKISVRHSKCNNAFEIRPRELIMGNQCPICNKQRNRTEKEVVDFVRSLLPDTEILENVYGLLEYKKYELDIYIPSLKVAIEFNGDWWHREEVVKDRSFTKIMMADDVDIRILTIAEHEWTNSRKLVENKIAYTLNVYNANKVYARKTKISELTSKEKNEFLEENHIQGKDKSFINLGLYHGDELVSVITITRPRKSLNSSHYEISRYASKQGINVVGGFSKLLKHAERLLPNDTELLTYASLSYSVGNLYLNTGFDCIRIAKPSYYYVKHSNKNIVYHRFTFNKKEIKRLYEVGKLKSYDDSLTEKENMKNNGYFSVMNCGNLVFTKTINH